MAYTIEFAESVKRQFRQLTANQSARILDAVEKKLRDEPLKETRNRKPLRPNPLAPWQLSVGNLRVFYEISSEEPNLVKILAIGEKRENQLIIAGKVVKL